MIGIDRFRFYAFLFRSIDLKLHVDDQVPVKKRLLFSNRIISPL